MQSIMPSVRNSADLFTRRAAIAHEITSPRPPDVKRSPAPNRVEGDNRQRRTFRDSLAEQESAAVGRQSTAVDDKDIRDATTPSVVAGDEPPPEVGDVETGTLTAEQTAAAPSTPGGIPQDADASNKSSLPSMAADEHSVEPVPTVANGPTAPAEPATANTPASPAKTEMTHPTVATDKPTVVPNGPMTNTAASAATEAKASGPSVSANAVAQANPSLADSLQAGGTVSANQPANAANSNVTPNGSVEASSIPIIPHQSGKAPAVVSLNGSKPVKTGGVEVDANSALSTDPKSMSVTANQAVGGISMSSESSTVVQAMQPASATPASAGTTSTPAAGTGLLPLPIDADTSALGGRNVETVTQALRTATAGAAGQRQSVTVRLDPPSLGSIRVHVQDVAGHVTATIATSSEVAHQLVRKSIDQLQSSLERSGMNIERVQITRMSAASAGETNMGGSQGNDPREGESAGRENMQQQQREQGRRESMLRRWHRGGFADVG